MDRRRFLGAAGVLGAAALLMPRRAVAGVVTRATAAPLTMTVYKSPSCGCCKSWIAYMKKEGFDLRVIDQDDLREVKSNAGVPASMESCHTGLIGSYVIEGHVPADLVRKIVAEKPKLLGLSVPGMVNGPPGMDDGPKQPYQVIAFTRDGKTSVYARRG
jgi:hypothetical protein